VVEAVARYAALARDNGLTPTQLALAWCYSRWFVASTIIGATNLDQLKHNIDAYVQLPKDVIHACHAIHGASNRPSPHAGHTVWGGAELALEGVAEGGDAMIATGQRGIGDAAPPPGWRRHAAAAPSGARLPPSGRSAAGTAAARCASASLPASAAIACVSSGCRSQCCASFNARAIAGQRQRQVFMAGRQQQINQHASQPCLRRLVPGQHANAEDVQDQLAQQRRHRQHHRHLAGNGAARCAPMYSVRMATAAFHLDAVLQPRLAPRWHRRRRQPGHAGGAHPHRPTPQTPAVPMRGCALL
jgi:hypothetical protein